MNIKNVVAVVGHESLAPDRLRPQFEELASDEFLGHRQNFDWQREGSEHPYQLGVVDDADKSSGGARQDFFPRQCAAAALYELQTLVRFVGPIDVQVQIAGFIQR